MTVTVAPPEDLPSLVGQLAARLSRLERRGGGTAYDENGVAQFPGGIDTSGTGDVSVGGTPDAPTGLTATPGALHGDVYADVVWSHPADQSGLVAYEMRVDLVTNPGPGESTEVVDVFVLGVVTATRLSGLRPNTTYDVYLYSRGQDGTVSTAASARFTTAADNTNPAQVTGVAATAGIRTIVAEWDEVADVDVASGAGLYEVQVDTAATFDTANLRTTRVGGTLASFGDLTTGTTYHVQVRAIDASGNPGAWSTADSVTTAEVGTDDIAADSVTADKMVVGTITAASGILADAVIVEAKIANLAVSNAKIDDLNVSKLTAGNLTATMTVTTGALEVGLGPGNTGLYLDSTGLRAYDGAVRTVFIDAATGNAEFTGEVNATSGSIVSMDVTGTLLVSGGIIKTATSGKRIQIDTSGSWVDRIEFYPAAVDPPASGGTGIFEPAYILTAETDIGGGPRRQLVMQGPTHSDGETPASITLETGERDSGSALNSRLRMGAYHDVILTSTIGSIALRAAQTTIGAGGSNAYMGYDTNDAWNFWTYAAGDRWYVLSNMGSGSSWTTPYPIWMDGSTQIVHMDWTLETDLIVITGYGSSADRVMSFGGSYDLWVDSSGSGGAGRWWMDTPNGGEIVLGPRSGSSFLNRLRVRGGAIFEDTITQTSDTHSLSLAGADLHSVNASGTYLVTSYARLYVYDNQQRVASLHPSSGYVPHYASAFVVGSSRDLKRDIADPDAVDAVGIFRRARTRQWVDANADVPLVRAGRPAVLDADGEVIAEAVPDVDLPPDPIRHRPRLGWVAEEVPDELVARDADGAPEGIDLMAAVALLGQAVADLDARLPAPPR